MLISKNKGQSVLEYALLLGVIIAAILIMQVFIKRGFQGNLQENAAKIGGTFSASSTTINETRKLVANQTITDEMGTNTTDSMITSVSCITAVGTPAGAYSFNTRSGGGTNSSFQQTTDAARSEGFKLGDYSTTNFTDLTLT